MKPLRQIRTAALKRAIEEFAPTNHADRDARQGLFGEIEKTHGRDALRTLLHAIVRAQHEQVCANQRTSDEHHYDEERRKVHRLARAIQQSPVVRDFSESAIVFFRFTEFRCVHGQLRATCQQRHAAAVVVKELKDSLDRNETIFEGIDLTEEQLSTIEVRRVNLERSLQRAVEKLRKLGGAVGATPDTFCAPRFTDSGDEREIKEQVKEKLRPILSPRRPGRRSDELMASIDRAVRVVMKGASTKKRAHLVAGILSHCFDRDSKAENYESIVERQIRRRRNAL